MNYDKFHVLSHLCENDPMIEKRTTFQYHLIYFSDLLILFSMQGIKDNRNIKGRG